MPWRGVFRGRGRATVTLHGGSLELNYSDVVYQGGIEMPKKSGSAGRRGRSAKTGRFVKQSTVKKNPGTTVNESTKRKK